MFSCHVMTSHTGQCHILFLATGTQNAHCPMNILLVLSKNSTNIYMHKQKPNIMKWIPTSLHALKKTTNTCKTTWTKNFQGSHLPNWSCSSLHLGYSWNCISENPSRIEISQSQNIVIIWGGFYFTAWNSEIPGSLCTKGQSKRHTETNPESGKTMENSWVWEICLWGWDSWWVKHTISG